MKFEWMKRLCCLFVCALMCTGFVACQDTENKNSQPAEPSGMGTNPEDVFNTKQKLYFDNLGNFKVVIFSDLRVSKNVDSKIISNMERILDREDPSLVLLGGDVHDGSVSNETELKTVLDALNAPMESRKIPWCHTFGVDTEGTEDKKTGYSRKDQMKVYQSYPYCLSVSGSSDVYGVSNYVLPICIPDGDDNPDNDRAGFNVWCLDANGYLNDYVSGLEDQVVLKRNIGSGTNLDCLHFSQLLWYWDTSVALEAYNEGKIPGMMYFQVPPYQFMLLRRNQEQTGVVGTTKGAAMTVSSSERESGVLWTCYERGDIKGIFCGYNEENDFSGTYLDILMAYCATVGNTDLDETAGARVVSISENGKKMESSMVHLNS